MTRKEFTERMAQIDPESEDAADELACVSFLRILFLKTDTD